MNECTRVVRQWTHRISGANLISILLLNKMPFHRFHCLVIFISFLVPFPFTQSCIVCYVNDKCAREFISVLCFDFCWINKIIELCAETRVRTFCSSFVHLHQLKCNGEIPWNFIKHALITLHLFTHSCEFYLPKRTFQCTWLNAFPFQCNQNVSLELSRTKTDFVICFRQQKSVFRFVRSGEKKPVVNILMLSVVGRIIFHNVTVVRSKSINLN